MKFISKLVCAAALFAAVLVPTAAKATPISGSIAIGGTDSFNSTAITFTPTTAYILASTIANVGTVPNTATLTGFSYTSATSANGVVLFTTTQSGITTSFTITGLTTIGYTATPSPFLNLAGTGFFSQTGMDNTSGSFSLTSSTTGITSFQLNGMTTATPEPSSLMLLGTGLVSSAGMLMRRRRNVVA